MNNEIPVIIQDNKNQKHILVQVNLKNKNTQVLSNFSAWENLSFLMEAIGATAQQCIREGYSLKKVKDAIYSYLKKVLRGYGVENDSIN